MDLQVNIYHEKCENFNLQLQGFCNPFLIISTIFVFLHFYIIIDTPENHIAPSLPNLNMFLGKQIRFHF